MGDTFAEDGRRGVPFDSGPQHDCGIGGGIRSGIRRVMDPHGNGTQPTAQQRNDDPPQFHVMALAKAFTAATSSPPQTA